MSVIEHQYLHYRNVLYFEMQFDYEEVESFVKKSITVLKFWIYHEMVK